MSEPIIIDGVNVAECEFLRKCVIPDNEGCSVDDSLCCDVGNCYFKKLKRLEKENEELKEKVNNYRLYGSSTVIQPNNHTNTEFDLLCQKNENLEQENEQLKAENDRQKETIIYLQNYDMCHKTLIQYKQALEEIKHHLLFAERATTASNYVINIKKIAMIVGEVLNDRD